MAITPDHAGALGAFAERYSLGYPLLSDVGGVVIGQYGIVNHNIPPNPRQAPGLPFPGQFLLAPDHTVLAKSFTGDLRHRASGTVLVFEAFGDETRPALTLTADEVVVRVITSADEVHGGQEVAVRVEVEPRDAWHVYAAGAPAPYVPLRVEFDPDGALLAAPQVVTPTGRSLRFAATGEEVEVLDRPWAGGARLRVRWSPPPSMFPGLDDAVARRAVRPGAYTVACRLHYQACRDDVCREPVTLDFELPLRVAADAAAAPAVSQDSS